MSRVYDPLGDRIVSKLAADVALDAPSLDPHSGEYAKNLLDDTDKGKRLVERYGGDRQKAEQAARDFYEASRRAIYGEMETMIAEVMAYFWRIDKKDHIPEEYSEMVNGLLFQLAPRYYTRIWPVQTTDHIGSVTKYGGLFNTQYQKNDSVVLAKWLRNDPDSLLIKTLPKIRGRLLSGENIEVPGETDKAIRTHSSFMLRESERGLSRAKKAQKHELAEGGRRRKMQTAGMIYFLDSCQGLQAQEIGRSIPRSRVDMVAKMDIDSPVSFVESLYPDELEMVVGLGRKNPIRIAASGLWGIHKQGGSNSAEYIKLRRTPLVKLIPQDDLRVVKEKLKEDDLLKGCEQITVGDVVDLFSLIDDRNKDLDDVHRKLSKDRVSTIYASALDRVEEEKRRIGYYESTIKLYKQVAGATI